MSEEKAEYRIERKEPETYTRKPIRVEAMQFTGDNIDEMRAWIEPQSWDYSVKFACIAFVFNQRHNYVYKDDWVVCHLDRRGWYVHTDTDFKRNFVRADSPREHA